MTSDVSELVQVSCLRVLQDFLDGLPTNYTTPMQQPVIDCISDYMNGHDLKELDDLDDLKVALIETLRNAIKVDFSCVLQGSALDLLFTLASSGASNFQISTLVVESFEEITVQITKSGHDAYGLLCARTIPSLTGAFDVASMTQESALTNLAAELVSALAEYGSEPLPDGFVAALMPKLTRALLEGTEGDLIRPATLAVQHMLSRGSAQFLNWTDSAGKNAVEVTLIIINRLLNAPDVDDNAAAEVGGLASELVNKAGNDKLGPYLLQLLEAVAQRLGTAQAAQFIQSLLMVFVSLTASAPKEVVDFLHQTNINGESGLSAVLSKWLENSIHFAGFSEIRQNVTALTKLYSLEDPRVRAIGVKGDLVIEQSTRIKTRSQAKKNPDQYAIIPADVKILKILTEELSSASMNGYQADPTAAAAGLDDEGGSDDDDWEDDDNAPLDLGTGLTRSQLMALENDDSPTSTRMRDDETAEYLAKWFKEESGKPGFVEQYNMLNEEERHKLQALVK